MNIQPCDLFKRIPREKLEYLFEHSEAGAELDISFLGFEDPYRFVKDIARKDMIIIDFGCAYATQSWYFREHEKYIGVDAVIIISICHFYHSLSSYSFNSSKSSKSNNSHSRYCLYSPCCFIVTFSHGYQSRQFSKVSKTRERASLSGTAEQIQKMFSLDMPSSCIFGHMFFMKS